MRHHTFNLIFLAASLVLLAQLAVFAQYRGEPVQRDKLIDTLRSKRFQSRDIVEIIKENGVDFKLSAATQNQLVAAGTSGGFGGGAKKITGPKGSHLIAANAVQAHPRPDDYNWLINEAVNAYDIKKNKQEALGMLERATLLQPGNPRAFQLLGFLSLYGNRDFDAAERHWKKSVSLGGNAVLRVTHDHDGAFLTSCQGSLYISRNLLRFESDNNTHTFETSDRNIKKIEVNSRWKRLIQLKGGSFKVLLDKEDGETKYNFAPLSGKSDESKMIIRLIGK